MTITAAAMVPFEVMLSKVLLVLRRWMTAGSAKMDMRRAEVRSLASALVLPSFFGLLAMILRKTAFSQLPITRRIGTAAQPCVQGLVSDVIRASFAYLVQSNNSMVSMVPDTTELLMAFEPKTTRCINSGAPWQEVTCEQDGGANACGGHPSLTRRLTSRHTKLRETLNRHAHHIGTGVHKKVGRHVRTHDSIDLDTHLVHSCP